MAIDTQNELNGFSLQIKDDEMLFGDNQDVIFAMCPHDELGISEVIDPFDRRLTGWDISLARLQLRYPEIFPPDCGDYEDEVLRLLVKAQAFAVLQAEVWEQARQIPALANVLKQKEWEQKVVDLQWTMEQIGKIGDERRWYKAHPELKPLSPRQKRMRDGFIEDVKELQLLDMYGTICYLCGKHIDPTIQYPDLLSLDIDHVIPLYEGGKHSYENCRPTHHGCNLSKGRKLLERWRKDK